MRLILSRKGFDSAAGGCPNPVFPDGSFYALPIPDDRSRVTYGDLNVGGRNIGQLVNSLTGRRHWRRRGAHLDPDLIADVYPRQPGWRPLLGQAGAAQGHLRNQQVGVGDLFLFFGLFRPVVRQGRGWRFDPGAPAFHALWGWLQVGQVQPVDGLDAAQRAWAGYHPHCHGEADPLNTLYLAADALDLPGTVNRPGAGTFPQLTDALRLTAPDARSPSQWRLPGDFYPGARPPLSFHGNPGRWAVAGQHCQLQAAARGQEFVLDCQQYPGVVDWLAQLLGPVIP